MNPGSAKHAGQQARTLLLESLRAASAATRKRRAATAVLIGSRIWCRFQAGPRRWRQKHMRWYCEFYCRSAAANTAYHHYLVLRQLMKALGKCHWLPHLRGPWTRPSSEKDVCTGGKQKKSTQGSFQVFGSDEAH
jgi:hypothetical protein